MVVEDEPALRGLIEGALTDAGYAVRTAEHGGVALSSLSQEEVDLIVTDLCMPHVDGMELMMELRRNRSPTPVIVISGGVMGTADDMLRAARLLGACRTIEKPFSMQKLVVAVREVLD